MPITTIACVVVECDGPGGELPCQHDSDWQDEAGGLHFDSAQAARDALDAEDRDAAPGEALVFNPGAATVRCPWCAVAAYLRRARLRLDQLAALRLRRPAPGPRRRRLPAAAGSRPTPAAAARRSGCASGTAACSSRNAPPRSAPAETTVASFTVASTPRVHNRQNRPMGRRRALSVDEPGEAGR
jgi:hypothetical protein